MSYLGKISAIVSANTSDFQSKLAMSGKDVRSWSSSVTSQISRAASGASSSLRSIYTDAQKLSRSLEAIKTKNLSYKGFDAKDLGTAIGRMEALYSITKQINQPLSEAARSLEKLPAEIQAGFLPAMVSAQAATERLASTINETGGASQAQFAAQAAKVDLITASMRRLQEVTGMVGKLSRGDSFKFSSPRSFDAITAANRAQSATENIPASILARFGIGEQQGKVSEAANRVARLEAVRERKLSLGMPTGRIDAMLEIENDRLEAQIRVLERRNEAAQKFALVAKGGAVSPDSLVRSAGVIRAARKDADDLRAALGRIADGINPSKPIDVLKERVDEARAAVAKLDPELREIGERNLAKIEAYLRKRPEQRSDKASDDDAIRRATGAATSVRDEANEAVKISAAAKAAQKDTDDLRAALGRVADGINPSRPIDILKERVDEASAAVSKLDPKLREIGERNLAKIEKYLRKKPEERSDKASDEEAAKRAAEAAARVRDEAAEAARLQKPGNSLNPIPPEDLKKSAAGLREMGDEMRKLEASNNFGTTLDKAFEESKITKAKAEIAALQGILIKVGATTGNAAEAVDDLAAAWQRATSEVGGTTKYARQLREVADEAAEAVQAAVNSAGGGPGPGGRGPGGGPKIDVKKVLASVGDVGRFGADKASLAFQQLGFAIDDFMSSTGGIDQKIRAVSNNISQMAYIVGSTKGLFAALGVTMAAQAAVMVFKYVAGGKTAEDQTKALNDALAKQKSLIEELQQAFESFANSLGRNIFSKSAGDARDFQRQIDEIVKKQKERRDSRLANLSPEVQKERSEQNRINRELEGATDMGQRAALLAQRAASERREKEAAKSAAAAPLPGAADIDRIVQGTIRANEFLVGGRMTARSEQAAEERRQKAREDVAGADTAQKQAEVVRARLAERQEMAARPITVGTVLGGEAPEIMRAREDVAALETLLAQLEEKIKDGGNSLAISILEGSVGVARSLEATQQLLDETLVPFSKTRAEADQAAAELTKIVEELKTAEDPARIEELKRQQDALREQSSALRAASSAVRDFADVMKRISTDLADTVAQEARSNADRARREANEATAQREVNGEFGPDGKRRGRLDRALGFDLERNESKASERRKRAEEEARRAEDEAAKVRQENEKRRMEFEAGMANDPVVAAENKRMQELQAVLDDKKSTEEQKRAAREEMDQISRTRQRRFEESPEGREATARADAADQKAARAMERERQAGEKEKAADRGRELAMTPAERASRELVDQLKDVRQAEKDGLISGDRAKEASERLRSEAFRSAAPMIFDMMDEVRNATLQGPSRQALGATDASTVEGQRELNRLLRGDDSAKDINLAELEKQSRLLEEIARNTDKEIQVAN